MDLDVDRMRESNEDENFLCHDTVNVGNVCYHADLKSASGDVNISCSDAQVGTNDKNRNDVVKEVPDKGNVFLNRKEIRSGIQESRAEVDGGLEMSRGILTKLDTSNNNQSTDNPQKELEFQHDDQSKEAGDEAKISKILINTVPVVNLDMSTEANDDPSANRFNTIENVLETKSVKSKVSKLCDGCLTENLEIDAVSFCTTCMEYLCENCHRFHSKCKATKDHNIVKELPADISIFKWMAQLMSCPQHSELKVTYICQNHKVNICLTCLVEDHRKCNNVQKLANLVSGIKDKSSDIITNIDKYLHLVTTHTAQLRENIEDIVAEKTNLIHSLGEQADELIASVLNMKKKAEKEIHQIVDTEISSLQNDIDLCSKLEAEEVSVKRVTEFLASEENYHDANLLRFVIWGKVRQHGETIAHLKTKTRHLHFIKNMNAFKPESLGTVKSYSVDEDALNVQLKTDSSDNVEHGAVKQQLFDATVSKHNPNESILQAVALENSSQQQMECSEFPVTNAFSSGAVLKPVLDFIKPLPFMGSSDLPKKLDQSSQSTKCVKEAEKHSIRLADDTSQCSITKCVVLKNGSITLIDSANNKLKKFSHTFKTCMYMTLEGIVSDICNTSGEEVAIVYGNLHKITVNDLSGNAIATVRTLSLPQDQNFRCIAADKVNERFALIYDTKFGGHPKNYYHIQIRSYKGQVVCDFGLESLTGLDIDFPLNSKNCGILYTPKGLILLGVGLDVRYIPETKSGNNLVLSKSKILHSCKDDDMQGMTNRTSDIQGNIYICSARSGGAVHQYNRSSNYRPGLVVSGISRPTAMDFLSNKKLAVGCSKDDFIHVYDFKDSAK